MNRESLPADSGDTEIRIDDARTDIDALDSRIIEVIQQRIRLSHRIQRQRMREGGPRTVLSREMAILDRYRSEIGAAGTAIATNILELCRGPVRTAPTTARTAVDDGTRRPG